MFQNSNWKRHTPHTELFQLFFAPIQPKNGRRKERANTKFCTAGLLQVNWNQSNSWIFRAREIFHNAQFHHHENFSFYICRQRQFSWTMHYTCTLKILGQLAAFFHTWIFQQNLIHFIYIIRNTTTQSWIRQPSHQRWNESRFFFWVTKCNKNLLVFLKTPFSKWTKNHSSPFYKTTIPFLLFFTRITMIFPCLYMIKWNAWRKQEKWSILQNLQQLWLW